ncbi:MAG: hypothetical protein ABI651_13680 [Verrucomicrobiota bacterium]
MNATTTDSAIAMTTAQTPGISRLVRRIHIFTGLFLAPWMVMYALSTLVMANHEYVNSFYVSKSPVMAKERELDYSRSFSTSLTFDYQWSGWKESNPRDYYHRAFSREFVVFGAEVAGKVVISHHSIDQIANPLPLRTACSGLMWPPCQ